MITEQHICEALSRACVQAISGRAGANLKVTREFDYGIDGSFHHVQQIQSRRVESGFALDFQLKASKRWILEPDFVVFDLEARTFNDLTRRASTRGSVPCILIVLCLPANSINWVEISEEQLIMRKCCYWHSLMGDASENVETVRIRIPRRQLLSPDSLNRLLQQVQQGEFTS